jgi:hypothetical protein
MNDPATLTGQPKPVTAGDETRLIYPLDAEGIGKLQAWVDAQFPNPFEVLDRELRDRAYNTAQQQFLMRTAMELSVRGRRLIGTPEADALINSAAGTKYMLFLAISRGDPAFTEADAQRFYEKRRHGGCGPARHGRPDGGRRPKRRDADWRAGPAGDGPDDGPGIDWWVIYNKCTNELQWPPNVINKMTIPQLLCVLNEKPPSAPGAIRTADDFAAMLEDAAWNEEK